MSVRTITSQPSLKSLFSTISCLLSAPRPLTLSAPTLQPTALLTLMGAGWGALLSCCRNFQVNTKVIPFYYFLGEKGGGFVFIFPTLQHWHDMDLSEGLLRWKSPVLKVFCTINLKKTSI